MTRPRRLLVSCLAIVVAIVSAGNRAGRVNAEAIPAALDDREFWRLVTTLSEPNGFFRSENLVSNERTFQFVIPALLRQTGPGGVYLGVAPDQNFAYITALRPRMAFIVDIRRGNLLEHLLYKALFELSPDRATFVAKLFSRPRPAALGVSATAAQIFDAVDAETSTDDLYRTNLAAVHDCLVVHHGFPLSGEDLQQLEAIYGAFHDAGPGLRYTAAGMVVNGMGGYGRYNGGLPDFPSYEDLQEATDTGGHNLGYLGLEAAYQYMRTFESHNLLVPIVGDFAGPKALRAVGGYIRAHGEIVTAFYVSNVEQYLMQDGVFTDFIRNVATLPTDTRSTFIRSVWSRYGYQGTELGPDGRASALDPIRSLVNDVDAGGVRSYFDLNVRSR
jgi:hypothetical protein